MIFHTVLFNPRAELPPESLQAFTRALSECLRSIPEIQRVMVGKRLVVDPGYQRSFGDETYEFAAVLEFESRAELVSYLNHPKHQELGRLFWLNCASTVVAEHEMIDGRSPELEQFIGVKT